MTNATKINAETHGEAAVELFENWHADCLLSVTDERLTNEADTTCTVSQLLDMLADNDWNLHGYTVGGPGENGSWVKDRAGNIVIEVAE